MPPPIPPCNRPVVGPAKVGRALRCPPRLAAECAPHHPRQRCCRGASLCVSIYPSRALPLSLPACGERAGERGSLNCRTPAAKNFVLRPFPALFLLDGWRLRQCLVPASREPASGPSSGGAGARKQSSFSVLSVPSCSNIRYPRPSA
jgi:hypothetical protein